MAEYDVAIEYIFGLMKDGTLKSEINFRRRER